MMDKRRAAQILKQNAKTVFRIMSLFEKGPSTARNVFDILKAQGMKDGYNLVQQYVTALHVAGKIEYVDKGIYKMPGEPIPYQPTHTTLKHYVPEALQVQMQEMVKPVVEIKPEPVIEHKEPEKVSMNLSDMTPDEIIKMSQQLQEIAAKKQREVDPNLIRKMLESGEAVMTASDMLAEAIDGHRKLLNEIRKSMGLPITK